MSRLLLAVFSTLFLFFQSLAAHAVLQRVYVSASSGNDANTATGCPANAPCRWFSTAVATVDSGGEVVAMDSGAYGAVTVSKSVSIIGAPGIYAGITVFSGNGVTISTASVKVVLRGLTINGMGGDYGVYMSSGASLTVDRCVISNFTSYGGAGVAVNALAQASILDSLIYGSYNGAYLGSGAVARISNSRFIGNSSNGLYAIGMAGVTTVAYVDHSMFDSNSIGIYGYSISGGTSRIEVKDSRLNGNSDTGIGIEGGGTTQASVSSSQISGNAGNGVYVGSGASAVVTGNTVTRNTIGLYNSGGTLKSMGDNTVQENSINTSGTITSTSRI